MNLTFTARRDHVDKQTETFNAGQREEKVHPLG